MTNKDNNQLTAAEEIILASYELSGDNKTEFSEWELTVKTWELNKVRWGLGGYEQAYPNHKRVMVVIMTKGRQNVLEKGFIERVKENFYKITDLGIAKAKSLSGQSIKDQIKGRNEYDSISRYISHRSFVGYCNDPNEPKTWLSVADFLDLKANDLDSLNQSTSTLNASIELSLEWLKKNKQSELIKDDASKPISKDLILKLKEFAGVLEKRFKSQFDAIRSRR